MKFSSWIFAAGGILGLLLLSREAAGGQPLPGIALQPVFTNAVLDKPTGMFEAPDGTGRFFVIQQGGRIVIVRKGTSGSGEETFLDISSRQPNASYEQGLLGFAFHPGFKTNGLFYTYYSQQNPRRCVLSEWKAAGSNPDRADMNSERVVMNIPEPYSEIHKAGQLCFGPDGYLYVAVGDGGPEFDPHNNAQNTSLVLGKILRIDVNGRQPATKEHPALGYGIPPDNPFVHENPQFNTRPEIWAYGFRNPWRFSFDRQTGELWVGDVGEADWEEVDRVVKGGDYGWSLYEGTHRVKPVPPCAGYLQPVMEYPHRPELLPKSLFPNHSLGMCVIGGFVYRGSAYPQLRGVYLYADYALGTLWGMRYQDGKVTVQGVMLQQPKNITTFAQDQEGELYVLSYDGKIFHIAAPAS